MKIKRCVVCQKDMPDYWQKMDDEEVKNLVRAFGIRPVCVECLRENWIGQFKRTKFAENRT
jgi:hypothetical protein